MGVKNLFQTLDSLGPDGAYPEGPGYGGFTMGCVLHAAMAMALAGDNRSLEHSFLKKYPQWLVQHLQPGRMGINAFDAFQWGQIPRNHKSMIGFLTVLVVTVDGKEAIWALRNKFDICPSDLYGLLAAGRLARADGIAEPPLFAHYDWAARVNWRENWGEKASGVWVRGGHKCDQHDHRDRGHVNFIYRGTPILIEAGTPAYHHPDIGRLFASGVGHNVLQLGEAMPERTQWDDSNPYPSGWQKLRVEAPIKVKKLDSMGGDISLEMRAAAYDHLQQWHRQVSWTAESITVRDHVVLQEGHRAIVLFRWHTGADNGVEIGRSDKNFVVQWPAAKMSLSSSIHLTVCTELLDDDTLAIREWTDECPYHKHVCVVVKTAAEVGAAELTTKVEGRQ